MKKITITVPYKSKKWKVSAFDSHGKHRATANSVWCYVEKQIFAKNNVNYKGNLNNNTSVKVKYSQDIINESLVSDQPQYLMFCLTCFLEDYLSDQNMLKKISNI